jgi:hypothetical protein
VIFVRNGNGSYLYRGYPDTGNAQDSPLFKMIVTSCEPVGFVPPSEIYNLDDTSDIALLCTWGCIELMFPRPRFNADGKKIDEKAYGFSMHYDEPNNQYFIYQFENEGFDFKTIKLQGKGKKAAALKYVLKPYALTLNGGETETYWQMRYIETLYHKTLPTAILPGEVTSSLISFYPPA